MALSLEQLSAGVTGDRVAKQVPGFEVEVHLAPLTMKQVSNLQKDLEALPEDDAEAHGKNSMALMTRATLCDEQGKSLTQAQALAMQDNSSPAFMLALHKIITEHISPSAETTAGN